MFQVHKNKNTHLCTLGPLVWKKEGLQYPKSIPTFILFQGALLTDRMVK